MLAKYPLGDVAPAADAAASVLEGILDAPVRLPQADITELIHLARAVLMKSPADLAAIAEAAPSMAHNWVEAFTAERERAQAEARFWSTAIAYLMVTTPGSIANDE